MSQEAGLTHRQRQALQTRRLIVDAATKLFLERGYGVTTMDAIAAEAGVAVSTVYAIFKNKRAFLREIKSAWPDLDAGRAAAILLALAQPEVYRELVEVAGWSPDQYEAWLAETLKEQLLPRR